MNNAESGKIKGVLAMHALACPFCAARDSFVERMTESTWQRVCNVCFCHGPEECGDWEDDEAHKRATLAWNKRTEPVTD